MEHGYWFRSTRFEVLRGEDRETSPGIYGRQLALWLRDCLLAVGYREAVIQPEPWGWCILLSRRPYLLWVGCGGIRDDGTPEGNELGRIACDTVLWHCHASADLPWPRHWWGHGTAEVARRSLDITLRGLLMAAPDVQLVDPPVRNA